MVSEMVISVEQATRDRGIVVFMNHSTKEGSHGNGRRNRITATHFSFRV